MTITVKKIKEYKKKINPQHCSVFNTGTSKMYAKIICLGISNLDEKLKKVKMCEEYYNKLDSQTKNAIFCKIMKYI